MSTAIDRLLTDRGLGERLGTIATRLQASPGNERAARLIERLAETGGPT
jgi:UDP:flavonoid glycosyltransferase YjiC (YdhE family)